MKVYIPLIVYILVCIIALFFPTSEEYNTLVWKFTMAQFYALPSLVLAIFITYFLGKNKKDNG